MSNGQIEVLVAAAPAMRVAAVRRTGGSSPLRAAADTYTGIRLQFMDPVSDDRSGLAASAPGTITEKSERHVQVETTPLADAGLRASMRVTLDTDRPAFTITHTLTNTSAHRRTLAAWSLASFNRAGRGYVSFGNAPRPYRTVSYFHWTHLPQPSIDMGLRAVAVDFAGELNGSSMKLGVHTDAGWWACLHGHEALISFVPHDADATYPEGGDNVTVFHGSLPDRAWAELEQVGPLRQVEPGASVTMVERLALIELVEPESPDAVRQAIEPVVEKLLRVSP